MTAIETEQGRRWAESKIKALTGGDKIAARFMRQDFFEYIPQFTLIVAGNHKPGLRSVDEAMRRRINLIPFTVTIPPAERDLELDAKLQAEWPGILAWMIDGCVQWQRLGLAPPKSVTDATASYLELQDAIAAWIEEDCELQPEAWESRATLFASWTKWANAAGADAGTRSQFIDALEARHGIEPRKREGSRGFNGIRLTRINYEEAHWNR